MPKPPPAHRPPGPLVQPANRQQPNPLLSAPKLTRRQWALLGLALGGGVLAAVAWFGFSFYQQYEFDRLQRRLDTFTSAENWPEAIGVCEAMLAKRPDDLRVRQAYVRAVDRAATTVEDKTRALKLYRELAPLVKDDLPLRERQLELHLELRQFPKAEEEADALLSVSPHSGIAWCAKLQAADAQAQTGVSAAAQRLRATLPDATENCAKTPELATRLAWLVQEELPSLDASERSAAAATVFDRLVERQPNNSAAWLARHRFRVANHMPGADEDLDAALRLSSDGPEVLLAESRRLAKRKDFPAAKKLLRQVIEKTPRDRRGYVELARVLDRQGRHLEALDACLAGTNAIGEGEYVLTMRGVQQLMALERMGEADSALDELDREIYLKPPRGAEIERVLVRVLLPMVRGAWFINDRKLGEAHDRLRFALRMLNDSGMHRQLTDEQIELHSQLARCYKERVEGDLAATEFETLAKLDPDDDQFTTGAAEAWLQMNRLELAFRVFAEAQKRRPLTPAEWGAVARLNWEQESRKPAKSRDWSELRAALKFASTGQNPTVALAILSANEQLASGDAAAAEAALRRAMQEHPHRMEVVEALSECLVRQGRPEEAEDALVRFVAVHPEQASSALLRSGALRRAGDLVGEQKLLDSVIPLLPAGERPAVWRRLAQSHLQTGDAPAALRCLNELAALQTGRLDVLDQLAELSQQTGDTAAARNWIARLQQYEGAQGTRWRYWSGLVELSAASSPTDSRVLDAARWQTEIQFLRPEWPAGYVLKGAIAEKRGDLAAAEENYRTAIDKGDTGPLAYEKLVNLLFQQNKLAEAQAFLDKQQSRLGADRDLAALSLASQIQQGNLARAMALAQQRLDSQPNDITSYLQRARVAQLAGANIEAAGLLRQTTQRWPDDPRGWQSRLDFHQQAGQSDEVRRLLDELSQGEWLAAGDRYLLLATGYEQVGGVEQADNFYRRALSEAPNSEALLLRIAAFFRQRDVDLADQALKQLLASAKDPGEARRRLAASFIQRGGAQNWDAAEALLAPSAAEAQQEQMADLRMKAAVAVRRGGSDNQRLARELLTKVVGASREATLQDRLLLARLCAADGLVEEAQQQFDVLLAAAEPPAEVLSTYIDWRLKTAKAAEATTQLELLEKLHPRAANTFALRLRWLVATGRDGEIQALARRRLDEAKSQGVSRAELEALYQTAAAASDESGDAKAADRWFDEGLPLAPGLLRPWSRWAAQHGQAELAVRRCLESAASNGQSRTMQWMCELLLQFPVPDTLRKEADAALSAATAAHPLDAELLMSVGTLRMLAGDQRDEAISLFQAVLALQPENSDALNNLAMLLSEETARQADALQLIERAQTAAGKTPGFVDTQAMVLLRMGRAQEAIDLLLPLVERPDALAAWRFHLALAYHARGERALAAAQMGKASSAELAGQLTPGERAALVQLTSALKTPAP